MWRGHESTKLSRDELGVCVKLLLAMLLVILLAVGFLAYEPTLPGETEPSIEALMDAEATTLPTEPEAW